MNQGVYKSIGRMAAGCLLGAVLAREAGAQSSIVNRITGSMLQTYHQNLFVQAGQSRGFTVNADVLIARKPVKQHDKARDYVLNTFKALGLQAKLQPFTFNTSFGAGAYDYLGCNNIIATIPGTDPAAGYYIIGAYYDTLDAGQPNPLTLTEPAPKSAGADMNATGVAALLCLADALRDQSFRTTILLVAFDASQKNFAGAQAFLEKSTTATPGGTAKKIDRALIKGMINIDTIGFGRKANDSLSSVLLYGGAEVPDTLRKKLGGALTRFGDLSPLQGGTIQSSDHATFWEAGIPACSVSEAMLWENPYTYTAQDNMSTPKLVNFNYAAKITRGVAGFLCERAGLQ